MSHLITPATIKSGDEFTEGYGTLTLTMRRVETAEQFTVNGYTNARVTLTDGTSRVIYSGTYLERTPEGGVKVNPGYENILRVVDAR